MGMWESGMLSRTEMGMSWSEEKRERVEMAELGLNVAVCSPPLLGPGQ